jgi:class 3 adenylate cyclase/tetratricopeptide (TPR) repeat protein
MVVCPSCGHRNPDSAKFCMECATRLGAAEVAEERKIVTALFCDLVAFTASSESADPEDVDRVLADYSAMTRSAIESYGGVVEKFIGDAVLGVFGVPAAHEDDAERAVRAGLRIVEGAEGLHAVGGGPLRLRVGINTGNALVRLGIAPGSGEGFLRGDSVNTAARIQSVAPEMGVAVGLATYEATSAVFDYEELDPAALKGKTEPVRIFHATAARARFGTDIIRTHDAPFVGREIDLALLKGIFDKTVAGSSPQLVTVVGEPGLGKSRLMVELFAYLDTRPELITWRQGRCLPYGEGVTFWALGEIVKAHAGILESDAAPLAEAKLDEVLPQGDDRAWFRQRLLPLIGIEAESHADREELFTAWARYLEHVADQDPTVLLFEDLHWADEAMLAFLEHLADREERVPLLILGTTRPELFERHPDYSAGLRNANRMNLSPLTEPETARLVSSLLDATILPAELQRPILERAEGNPLYAEEFVRLLRDRDLVVKKGQSWELRPGADVPFPDSILALLAARLDTLTPEVKSILADAAVVGKVFWAGAIARMSGRDLPDVVDALRELTRKELVRPSRRSSIEGEAEYAFWHILARDVAYAQLPRASRAARHAAAGAWLESKASERVEDLADVLAYHYSSALELARAAGDGDTSELERSTLRFLILAGDRALGLDTPTALINFERALSLTPPGHPDRPAVLARFGQAVLDGGRPDEAEAAFREAIAAYRERGDLAAAAATMLPLVQVMSTLGDPRTFQIGDDALAILEPLPPGPELVGALTEIARAGALAGKPREGIRDADRALVLAEEIEAPTPARALGYRGLARCELGDAGGLDDMRQALRIAIDAGQGREAGTLYNNLGRTIWGYEGPTVALEIYREGIDFDRARGLDALAVWCEGSSLDVLIDLGELEEAIIASRRVAEAAERESVIPSLITARAVQARGFSLRGQAERAGDLDWLEVSARATGAPEVLTQAGGAAIAWASLGETERAAALLGEVAAAPAVGKKGTFAAWLPSFVRAALAIGERTIADVLAARLEPDFPYARHAKVAVDAALAEDGRDLERAADGYADATSRWAAFGVVPEEAFAALGRGRCLVALGRASEAAGDLHHSRRIFERLGTPRELAEIDQLLAQDLAR